jgi:hypothetical protein
LNQVDLLPVSLLQLLRLNLHIMLNLL